MSLQISGGMSMQRSVTTKLHFLTQFLHDQVGYLFVLVTRG